MNNIVKHLKKREGVVYESYRDSLGKLTGGVGHLLSPREAVLYPEGTYIAPVMVDSWLVSDIALAKKAAQRQCEELLEPSQQLEDALVHVNFQLGTSWNKIHKKTWKLMTQGRYEEAAVEVLFKRSTKAKRHSEYHGNDQAAQAEPLLPPDEP